MDLGASRLQSELPKLQRWTYPPHVPVLWLSWAASLPNDSHEDGGDPTMQGVPNPRSSQGDFFPDRSRPRSKLGLPRRPNGSRLRLKSFLLARQYAS